MKHVFEDVYKLIKKSFDEHKETFQADQLRDYMDVYIKEMNSAEKVFFTGFFCTTLITKV